MPYYIYRVPTGPVKILEKITQFDAFKDASAEAKRMRKEVDLTKMTIKVVFGENEIAGRRGADVGARGRTADRRRLVMVEAQAGAEV